jgi:hypothetical protein
MTSSRAYWQVWVGFLRRWGVDGLTLGILQVTRPLNPVAAQLLYLSQPLLFGKAAEGAGALAQLLEEEDETQAFEALLKG